MAGFALTLEVTAKEVIEPTDTSVIEADDFAIEHGFAIDFDVDRAREFREALIYVPAARDETRFVLADMSESAESVHLQLEEEVLVVEGRRQAR